MEQSKEELMQLAHDQGGRAMQRDMVSEFIRVSPSHNTAGANEEVYGRLVPLYPLVGPT